MATVRYDKGRETRELNRTERRSRGTRNVRRRLFKVESAYTAQRRGRTHGSGGKKDKEKQKKEKETGEIEEKNRPKRGREIMYIKGSRTRFHLRREAHMILRSNIHTHSRNGRVLQGRKVSGLLLRLIADTIVASPPI